MNEFPLDLSLFFGRFHPLLVHLPIGFLLLLACLEILSRWQCFHNLSAARGTVLALSVPAAALSALCGWLLSRGGDYDARLLEWHMWAGFGVAGACLLALILHWLKWRIAYDAVLAATLLGLLVASHFGGSLTHGSDYLTRYLPALERLLSGGQSAAVPPAAPAAGAAEHPAFAALVQPAMTAKCVACHGPDKAKGGLRLDSLEAVLKGGKSGPVLVPGNAAASELIKRLQLPPDHDDHMPPAGKPQPTADEIALLQWWIDAGAAGDKTATELKLPAKLQSLIAPQAAAPTTPQAAAPTTPQAAAPTTPEPAPAAEEPEPAAKPLAEVLPLAQRLASELGIALLPLAQGEPWLQANASLARTNFGDAELAKLAPLAANLRWLDLTGTAITDKGMAQVAGMPHLTRLHLARTAVTAAGLQQLASLGDLAYLNLHGTPLTDAALEHLKPLRKLRQLFLWQTGISSSAAQSFAEQSLDKDQIARWQAEIADLTAKIKSQGIAVDLGTPLAAAETPAAKPINELCPVSDKAVDPTKTSVYEGKLVAFCCADCKAAFDKDPKPFLAKLGLVAATPPTEPEKKP